MHHTQVPLIGGLLCHPQSSVSRVAGERCHGAEEKWEVANVHCNTRFIKEHKPSNHIRARIKSHVYTIE